MCFEKVSDVKNKNLPVWGSVIQRHRCRCVAYICVLVDMFLETVEDISINMVIKDIEPMNLESLYLIKNFINILSGITKKIITISFILYVLISRNKDANLFIFKVPFISLFLFRNFSSSCLHDGLSFGILEAKLSLNLHWEADVFWMMIIS